MFIFRSGKSLVLPTMLHAWRHKLENERTPRDNSSLISKFEATVADVSDPMNPAHSRFAHLTSYVDYGVS